MLTDPDCGHTLDSCGMTGLQPGAASQETHSLNLSHIFGAPGEKKMDEEVRGLTEKFWLLGSGQEPEVRGCRPP